MTVTPATHWTRDFRPPPRVVNNVSSDLAVISSYAESVGLGAGVYPLGDCRRMVDRASRWETLAWEGRAAADQAAKAAQQRALEGPEPSPEGLAAYVAELERVRPWLEEGQPSIDAVGVQPKPALALAAARALTQQERWRAGQLLQSATAPLYTRFAAVAAEAVAMAAACLPLPPDVWGTLEPVNRLPADTLAALQAAERAFNLCHAAGLHLRSMGLQGLDQLVGDEPPLALTFRSWKEPAAQGLGELRRTKPPLQLPSAIRRGWDPGLWTRADLEAASKPQPARRRLLTLGGKHE